MFSLIDSMGVDNDIALRRLPEDLRQPHHRKPAGIYDILQHASGPHRGKLIHISHQNQPCPHGDRQQQRVDQIDIHHGHLIDDHHILIQGMLRVSPKLAPALLTPSAADFQKPVDRLGFTAGGLRHPLGRPPCGSCQPDVEPLRLKIIDQSVNRGRFSRTGPSRNYQKAVPRRLYHCVFLHLIQNGFPLFLNPGHLRQNRRL